MPKKQKITVNMTSMFEAWAVEHGVTFEHLFKGQPELGFLVQTIAGPMRCHTFDEWIACCFLDSELPACRSAMPAGANPGNGKWNHHLALGLITDERLRAFFASFTAQLERLIPAKTT